jgi:hypothetical protein
MLEINTNRQKLTKGELRIYINSLYYICTILVQQNHNNEYTLIHIIQYYDLTNLPEFLLHPTESKKRTGLTILSASPQPLVSVSKHKQSQIMIIFRTAD